MRKPAFAFFITALLLITSCEQDRLDVDVSGIALEIKTKRLDQDLFEKEPGQILQALPALKKKYGEFFNVYCNDILNIRLADDEVVATQLRNFVTDKDMRNIYKDVQQQYAKLDFLDEALTDAFKHYKYHFPDSAAPEVIAHISGLNYAVFTTPDHLAIGLDMFLGSDAIYYEMLGLPKYMTQHMTREEIVVASIKGWAFNKFEYRNEKGRLLDEMVQAGKILYLMDALFPDEADSLKIGFTKSEMDWCLQNETNLWAVFVEKDYLYTTDHATKRKFMGEGPFTPGLPRESPARTGEFIGWQIVRKFMEEHPEMSVPELMQINDAQHILTQSKYKPKK